MDFQVKLPVFTGTSSALTNYQQASYQLWIHNDTFFLLCKATPICDLVLRIFKQKNEARGLYM